ncbi:MAG: hypothetical protein ACRED8_08385 [Caulobacteraceae bacterium]
MPSYTLAVFHPSDKLRPIHQERMAQAADVLTAIPKLLAAHPECEQIVVTMDGVTRLFAVDCKGNHLPD